MPDRFLLINYHYVRDPRACPYPGIHPIAPDAFARQIKALAARFRITSAEELEDVVLAGRLPPSPSILITFDDGLVDHAQTARDILDPLGIKAVFFVCSRPLTERRALAVHKIHWLRATTEPVRFRTDLIAALPQAWRVRQLTVSEQEAARRTYIYDRKQDGEIKYLLNFVLPEDVVDVATDAMLERRGVNQVEFCRRTYMGREALRELVAAGHRVEAHSHDHRPVTRLGKDEDALMALNVRTLEETVGRKPTWVSYPYGRGWALPKDPAAFCRRHGFKFGVTLEGTWVKPDHAPYALDRINTNEVERVVSECDVAAR